MRGACFLLTILPVLQCFCPEGFDLVKDGQCRGQYGTLDVAHSDELSTVISKCKEINAQPVIIHTEEQNTYWTTRDDNFPIGIVCNNVTERWEWADGSIIDYKPPAGTQNDDLDKSCGSGCTWQGYKKDGDWQKYCDSNLSWSSTKKILCVTQLVQPIPADDGCDMFEDDSDDGVCYQIDSKAENWQEAQTICRRVGANVASIHNEQENSFIRRLAVSRGEVKGVFIGATKSGKSDDYSWTDGSAWNYDNFYPGFPMDGYGDCVIMDTEGTSGLWANVECSSQWSVACIRQQNYTPPACSPGPWREGELIFSPGFPFDASTPCDFIFEVDAGKRVEVEVLLLEANSCCDHLILFEDYVGGTVVTNLTGEISDKTYTTSSSNFMRVSWQPTGGVNVRGMMMTFRGV